MRYLTVLLFSALLFAACSGSKDLEMGAVNQQPCQKQGDISTDNPFATETVENLNVYQQGEWVYASMDVRTYCNARIVFSTVNNNNELVFNLRNAGPATGDCVCTVNVSAPVKNVPKGTYNVVVMKEGTNQMLAQQQLTVQ